MTLTWRPGRVPVLGATLLLVFGGVTGVAAQTVVKLAHAVSAQDPYQYGSERFKEYVEKGTSGRLQVQIFPAGQLGNEREIIEGVKLGTIEGLVASAPLAGFSTAFLLFDLPFLFSDAGARAPRTRRARGRQGRAHAGTAWDQSVGLQRVRVSMMFNSKRAVRSPDDLRGLKFRVMENPVYVSLFRAFGSSAVPIPFGEVYGAIQTGVVDGAEIPVNVIYANKMYEQAKHMSLTRHTYTPTPFIANVGFLQKLTGDDQRLVVQAARDASVAQRALIDQRTNEFIDLLKKQGMQVTEVDTAAFRPRPPPSTRSLRRGSARTCSTRCCEASDA